VDEKHPIDVQGIIENEAIDRLQKIDEYDFTSKVEKSLKEILEYMSRNKKKRKID